MRQFAVPSFLHSPYKHTGKIVVGGRIIGTLDGAKVGETEV
jgi:hypothetical protein